MPLIHSSCTVKARAWIDCSVRTTGEALQSERSMLNQNKHLWSPTSRLLGRWPAHHASCPSPYATGLFTHTSPPGWLLTTFVSWTLKSITLDLLLNANKVDVGLTPYWTVTSPWKALQHLLCESHSTQLICISLRNERVTVRLFLHKVLQPPSHCMRLRVYRRTIGDGRICQNLECIFHSQEGIYTLP